MAVPYRVKLFMALVKELDWCRDVGLATYGVRVTRHRDKRFPAEIAGVSVLELEDQIFIPTYRFMYDDRGTRV